MPLMCYPPVRAASRRTNSITAFLFLASSRSSQRTVSNGVRDVESVAISSPLVPTRTPRSSAAASKKRATARLRARSWAVSIAVNVLVAVIAPPPAARRAAARARNSPALGSAGPAHLRAPAPRSSLRAPLLEERFERLLLRPVDRLAALPRLGLDQFPDRLFDTVAKVVRVHGVQLPTPVAVVAHEPSEA